MDIRFQYIKQPNSNSSPLEASVSFENPHVVLIGRETNCDLTLACEEKIISRQHARISRSNNVYVLTDISANGTFINKQSSPIGNGNSVIINDKDIIRLGDYALKIYLTDASTTKNHRPPTNNIALIKKTAPSKIETAEKNLKKQKKHSNSTSYNKKRDANHSSLGNINESFSPPNVTIPENWNMDITPEKSQQQSNLPDKLKKSINFAEQETKLLKSLLKGLGISQNRSDTQLTPDNMLTLGRCLRVSLTGMIEQRNHVDKIKAKLCFDDKNMLKDLNYSSFANFETADDFLNEMFAAERTTHSEFPLEVIKCQKEIVEDQDVIYRSFNKAIDSFREELSPFVIEQMFHEKNNNLTEKLVPSLGKWETYKKQWSEKCLSFKKIIKNNFETNIKELHTKRIEERKVIQKKD